MRRVLLFLIFLLTQVAALAADDALVVIGHSGLPKTDLPTLQRVYSGRAVSINQVAVVPLNLQPRDPLRQRFLALIMGQNEEQYTGYWLVRQYVGKGAPPEEVATVEVLLKYIMGTPGALGYLPASKVPAGSNVIYKQ